MNQIKIRYVWRNRYTKELKLASFHIKVVEACDIFSELPDDKWELISRDLWTGLTDKMGREIYAGDIVQTSSNHVLYEDVGEYLVKFIDGGFRLIGTNREIHCDLDKGEVSVLYLQIIGTIHTHPNLLDSGDKDE